MNNKAKAKAKAEAQAWLKDWMEQHPGKARRTAKQTKVPIRNNRRESVGKSINSVWQHIKNPSPRKGGLWGWHKT